MMDRKEKPAGGRRHGLLGKKVPRDPEPRIDYARALSLIKKCSEAKHVDEALRIMVNDACILVGGRGRSIWLVGAEDQTKVILRWTYRPEGPSKVGASFYSNKQDANGFYDGLTGWVFATGQPLCLEDITNPAEVSSYPNLKWDDKYGGFKQAPDKAKQRHYMAVPICSCRAMRKVIGVLRLGATSSAEPFDRSQLALLQAYAGYLSGLLTNYVKTEEERTLVERLFTVAGQSDLEMLLDEMVRSVPIVIDGSHCSIFLKNEDGDYCLESTSAPNLHYHTRREAGDRCLTYRPGSGKTGTVALTGKTCRVSGNITSEAGKGAELCESGAAVGAFLCSPIREQNGTPDGVVRVVRELDIAHEFDGDDERFLDTFGSSPKSVMTVFSD